MLKSGTKININQETRRHTEEINVQSTEDTSCTNKINKKEYKIENFIAGLVEEADIKVIAVITQYTMNSKIVYRHWVF